MSDAFGEREKGFERKFQRDQDQEFRVRARRDRLLATWVAEQLGLNGAAVEAYVRDVIAVSLAKTGDVLAKVSADLNAAQHPVIEKMLLSKLAEFQAEALQEVVAAPPSPPKAP